MYCTRCGVEMDEQFRYCPQCGTASPLAQEPLRPAGPPRQLSRWMADRKIAGVCSGVARYLAIDVTLVRLIWFCCIFVPVPAILAYIICWVILPKEYLIPKAPPMSFDPATV